MTCPGSLTWFTAYFILLASECKKQGLYSSGVAMIYDALETYFQAILIFGNVGEFNNAVYYKFTIGGSPIAGVGSLWKEVQEIVSSWLTPDRITEINEIIGIRNNSIYGHGILHANEEMFNKCFTAINSFIADYEEKNAPLPKNLWANLMSLAKKNIYLDSDKIIISNAFQLLSIRMPPFSATI